MSAWLENLVTLTIAGSVVVAGMLLLRPCLPRAFTAKWQYLIGKTALIFYLFPVVYIIQRLSFSSSKAITPTQSLITDHGMAAIPKLALPAGIGLTLFMIWAMGVVLFGGWHLYCFFRFSRKIKRASFPVPQNSDMIKLVSSYRHRLGIAGSVRIAYNDEIGSPVLIGLLKPTILLPHNLPQFDLGMVIHHELVHLKRKDLWVKLLVLIASAIHWFNPFVHRLRKEIHIWSELSCDEEVVKEMSPADRKRYGETILNLLERAAEMPTAFSAPLSDNGRLLKQRLVRLLHVKKSNKVAVGITFAAIIAAGGLGAATAVWAAPYIPAIQSYMSEEKVSAPTQPVVQEEQVKWVTDSLFDINVLEEHSKQPKKINLEEQLDSLEYEIISIPSEIKVEQTKVLLTQ